MVIMKKLINFLVLLLLTLESNSQFEFKVQPYFTTDPNFSGFLDSSTFCVANKITNRIYFQNIYSGFLDTISTATPFSCSDNKILVLELPKGFEPEITTKECIPTVNSNFSYNRLNQTFKKSVLPNGRTAFLGEVDAVASKKYYYSENGDSIYVKNVTNNTWDSILTYPHLIFPLRISNNNGILWTMDTSGTVVSRRLASTNDGCKTYKVLTNIDYNKPPLTTLNNGILSKLTIITNDFWIAQYRYDSSNVQLNKIYFTIDQGTKWNVLFNFSASKIVAARNSVVYIYRAKAGKLNGELYQVSNYGSNVCKTNFNGTIVNMNFFGANNGLILTIDTPNNQPGIWRIQNGGGPPCFINGIKEEEITEIDFGIAPNPSRNKITITSPFYSHFQIINMMGQTVMEGTLSENEKTIPVDHLSQGVYIFRMGGMAKKWIKN